MTASARDAIFANIRRSLRRPLPIGPEREAVLSRLDHPSRNVMPARARLPHAEQVDLFASMAVEMQASLDRVATEADVPAAVAAFLRQAEATARVAAAPALERLDWAGAGLDARFGRAEAGDLAAVTPCLCAVAETGTVVVASSAGHPTTLNFMPDIHIILVRASDVVGTYEEAWTRLRDQGAMPRTVTWITGPSRTADIEQTILLGAHGPRRLHIVLIHEQR